MVSWGVTSVNKLIHHLCFFFVEQVMSDNLCISFSTHPLPYYRNSCLSLDNNKSSLIFSVLFIGFVLVFLGLIWLDFIFVVVGLLLWLVVIWGVFLHVKSID